MINTNRIVPITAVDLISMYGLILLQNSNNSSMTALQASTVDGQFSCGTGVIVCPLSGWCEDKICKTVSCIKVLLTVDPCKSTA